MRELCLDTETTGLSPSEGDRIVSLGCVELIDGHPTGQTREWFFNPQRPVGDSVRVHGLTDAFLAEQPLFADAWPEIAAFLAGARLVIHNAAFDVAFLNAEFRRLLEPRPDPIALNDVTDTLVLARRLHPGQPAGLDALLARYRIGSKAQRGIHGALKDAQLLAQVYAELRIDAEGGRQRGFDLAPVAPHDASGGWSAGEDAFAAPTNLSRLTDAERERHAAFVATLGANPIWGQYLGDDDRRVA